MHEKVKREEFGSTGALYQLTMLTLKIITPIAVLIVLLHGLEWLPFMEYGN